MKRVDRSLMDMGPGPHIPVGLLMAGLFRPPPTVGWICEMLIHEAGGEHRPRMSDAKDEARRAEIAEKIGFDLDTLANELGATRSPYDHLR